MGVIISRKRGHDIPRNGVMMPGKNYSVRGEGVTVSSNEGLLYPREGGYGVPNRGYGVPWKGLTAYPGGRVTVSRERGYVHPPGGRVATYREISDRQHLRYNSNKMVRKIVRKKQQPRINIRCGVGESVRTIIHKKNLTFGTIAQKKSPS